MFFFSKWFSYSPSRMFGPQTNKKKYFYFMKKYNMESGNVFVHVTGLA